MRTVHEYEAADIDLKDPVHGWLMGALLVGALSMKPMDGEEAMDAMRRVIADCLNQAQKQGISITKSELPSVFDTR